MKSLKNQIYYKTCDSVGDQLYLRVLSELWDDVREQVQISVQPKIMTQLRFSIWSQLDNDRLGE